MSLPRPRSLVLAAFGLALLNVGCSQRNALGRRVVTLLPDSALNSQAATLFAEEKTKKPLAKDPRQVALVQRVADRLVAQANAHFPEDVAGFQWEVQLFEAPDTVNAYCMPGGKIGFYTGILPVCANEAGVAAVMGHEIAHALLRHGNARATQAMGMQALQAIAAKASAGSGDLKKQALMTAVGLGAQFGVVLPNSRVDENEADRLGLQLMARAGYDPSEAPRLWERMKAKSGGGQPEWMSTHPAEDRRIRRLTEFQAESAPLYAASPVKYGLGESLVTAP